MPLIILTLIAALSMALTAAYFSVVGLGHLFAASFIPVVIMASAVEFGKIVGTSWLYQTWEYSGKFMKAALFTLVFGAMVVTSVGVYGFLSKGFLDVQAPIELKHLELSVVNEELANVKERIGFIDEEITNYRLEMKDLQSQIDNYPKNFASKRITTYNKQKPRRAEINEGISELRDEKSMEMQLIKSIATERAKIKSDVIEVEGDIGPIKYVAATLGIAEDQAVRALIILLIIILDPFAILLIIGANMSISRHYGKKNASISDLFGTKKKAEIKETPDPSMDFIVQKPPLTEGSAKEKVLESPIFTESVDNLPNIYVEEVKHADTRIRHTTKSIVPDVIDEVMTNTIDVREQNELEEALHDEFFELLEYDEIDKPEFTTFPNIVNQTIPNEGHYIRPTTDIQPIRIKLPTIPIRSGDPAETIRYIDAVNEDKSNNQSDN